MSFGFSVGDLAFCVKVSYSIYHVLRYAPEECTAFAEEILHLHDVLERLWDEIKENGKSPEPFTILNERQPGLSEHGSRCLKLLLVDVMGDEHLLLSEEAKRKFSEEKHIAVTKSRFFDLKRRDVFLGLRTRFSQARFLRKIPPLREAVAGIVSKSTVENVLLMKHKQEKVLRSQDRIKESQTMLMDKFAESDAYLKGYHDKHLFATYALQESQNRIEDQLQQILKAQSRHTNPVLSGSLDASSPEGRQTWMELGRLLRDEGITPNIITKNKGLLIQAMKKTLQENAGSPDATSFKTALEYPSFPTPANHSLRVVTPAEHSMSLLSSAPSLGATFPEHFAARSSLPPTPLEHEVNVEDGMRSLMGAMTELDHYAEPSQQPGDDVNLVDGTLDDTQSLELLSRPDAECREQFQFASDLQQHVWSTGHRIADFSQPPLRKLSSYVPRSLPTGPPGRPRDTKPKDTP